MAERIADALAFRRYAFTTPTQDRYNHPAKVVEGNLVRAVGVDGRFSGAARSFPGFTTVLDIQASPYNGFDWDTLLGNLMTNPYKHLPPIDNTGLTNIWYAKYLSVQIPAFTTEATSGQADVSGSSRVLRGFAIAHDYDDSGTPRGMFAFYFYDPVEARWAYHPLMREVDDLTNTGTFGINNADGWDSSGADFQNIWAPYNEFLTDRADLLESTSEYDVASLGNFIYFTIVPAAGSTVSNGIHRSVFCGGVGVNRLHVGTAGSEQYGFHTRSHWSPTFIGPPWTKLEEELSTYGNKNIEFTHNGNSTLAPASRSANFPDHGWDNVHSEDNGVQTEISGLITGGLRFKWDRKNVEGPLMAKIPTTVATHGIKYWMRFNTFLSVNVNKAHLRANMGFATVLRGRGYRGIDSDNFGAEVGVLLESTMFREESEELYDDATYTPGTDQDGDDTSPLIEVGVDSDYVTMQKNLLDVNRNNTAYSPRKIRRILPYQATLLRIGTVPIPPQPLELFDRDEILSWGSLSSFAPEEMNVTNSTPLGSSQDEVALAMVAAGDYAFVVGDTSIFRIHRNGTLLAINEIQSLSGGVNRYAAVGVGASLVYVSPAGAYFVDGATGDFQRISVLDRIIQDEWASTLANIHVSYDSVLEALIFMNTSTEEVVFLWSGTGHVTSLRNTPYKFLSYGVDPVQADYVRNWWFDNTGKVFVVNANRGSYSYDGGTEGAITMCGGDSTKTWNGAVAASPTPLVTTVDITGASYDASCVGFEIHFLTGANQGLHRTISATAGTKVSFAALPQACAEDDRIAIAPIVVELLGWPIQFGVAADPFQRKIVQSMSHHINLIGGDTTIGANVNLYVEHLLYTRSNLTTAVTGPNTKPIEADQTKNYTRTHYAGTIIYPSWRCYCANLDLEFIEGLVHLDVRPSEAETAPVA